MILILIISQISGHYFGVINPISFFVLLFFPSLLKNLQGDTIEYVRPFWRFFAFWMIYNLCSVLWAPLPLRSIYYSFLFFINFMIFMEIIVFSKKASLPHDSIATGWLLAFLLTSFVGIWELQTGNHLSVAKEHLSRENPMADEAIGSYTSVTFYNINTYAIYILEVIPFIFYILASNASMKKKIIAFYCFLVGMVFILINGSRGASLSLMVMSLVFVWLLRKGGTKSIRWTLFAILIVSYLFYTYGEAILAMILFRMEMKGFEDNSRQVLYAKTLELIYNSCGIGTGVGSMVPAMEAQGNYLRIYYSHNLFLEYLLQFGVVLFSGFIYYLYKLFVKARRVLLPSKIVLYSALFGLPFYSVINSEYTHLHFVWCYFATLFVYTSSNSFDQHAGITKLNTVEQQIY